ncbi:MAG: hypothetical protein AB1480_17750 [Nitrospirota bacterium]
MEEITYPVIQDSTFEKIRHEILCEDIIKKLRPAVEQYVEEVRRFISISMVRGFDRNMIRHSITVFQVEIMNLITMAEDSLVLSNSPKTKILEIELQGLKASIGAIMKSSEKIILEEPNIENQIFFEEVMSKVLWRSRKIYEKDIKGKREIK